MARIVEEMVVVKVSTIVKDDYESGEEVFNDDICAALEDAISGLVGKGQIVEIIKD